MSSVARAIINVMRELQSAVKSRKERERKLFYGLISIWFVFTLNEERRRRRRRRRNMY